MVTFATLMTMAFMLTLITTIDILLFKVPPLVALQMTFDVHLSIGGGYLVTALITAIASAIIIDIRRWRNKPSA